MYLQYSEFLSDVPALLRFDNQEELAGIVGQIIDSISRIFDAETFAPEGYYGWRPKEIFEVKDFITNGTNFVHTYHFTTIDDILYGDSSVFERCIIGGNQQYIELGYGSLYPSHSKISVSAKWGWLRTPEDVKQAVAAKARIRFSMTPMGRTGVEAALAEEDITELNKIWDNAVLRYRHLNQFANR